MVREFTHEASPMRVVFAPGALHRVPDEVTRLQATRVVLIAGDLEAHWADVVARGFGDRLAARISDVVQHVPVAVAEAATARAKDAEADLLVSIGGGSATGLAKAVARELGTPILAVPTTYAGSEMTPIWGQTEAGAKITGRDERVRPRVVVYDPELTVGLPPGLTAASGLNAMAHCVEALYAPDASPVTRLVAEDGARSLATGLPRCIDSPEDLDARSDVLCGAWLGGWSLGSVTMGLHHKLCHVLGGAYDLPHAPTHAVVLPYATAYVEDAAPQAMARLARALGTDQASPVRALRELTLGLHIPSSLTDLGMPADGIPRVVEDVLAHPPPSPRPIDPDSLTSLLRRALQGTAP